MIIMFRKLVNLSNHLAHSLSHPLLNVDPLTSLLNVRLPSRSSSVQFTCALSPPCIFFRNRSNCLMRYAQDHVHNKKPALKFPLSARVTTRSIFSAYFVRSFSPSIRNESGGTLLMNLESNMLSGSHGDIKPQLHHASSIHVGHWWITC